MRLYTEWKQMAYVDSRNLRVLLRGVLKLHRGDRDTFLETRGGKILQDIIRRRDVVGYIL